MNKRKSYTFSFKRTLIEESKLSSIAAVSRKYGIHERSLKRWRADLDLNLEESKNSRRKPGAGRKPILGELENQIFDWIIDRRQRSLVVSREDIKKFASEAFEYMKSTSNEDFKDFKASNHWLDNFMKRNHLSLRKSTTLFKLEDSEIVKRAINYKNFIEKTDFRKYDEDFVICMDETAVYCGENSQNTVDKLGATSIYVPSTGYESYRVTCILAITKSGKKLPPLLIARGSADKKYVLNNVDVYETEKAWATQKVIRSWISKHFSRLLRGDKRGLVIWDSASTHRAKEMKTFLVQQRIDQIMIPAGTTSYLQSLDLVINKPFKDQLAKEINNYLEFRMERNAKGNQKKPSLNEISGWVNRSWEVITASNVSNALRSAYLLDDSVWSETSIMKHERIGPLIKIQLSEVETNKNSIVVDDEIEEEDFSDPTIIE